MPQLLGFFASELILGENNAQENQEILIIIEIWVLFTCKHFRLTFGIYVLLIAYFVLT